MQERAGKMKPWEVISNGLGGGKVEENFTAIQVALLTALGKHS